MSDELKGLMKEHEYRVSSKEAIVVYRRVLRMVDRYLKSQRQDLLVTEGRGLMTWGEIRHHIKSALKNIKVVA